jgi:hypothetical protein
LGEGTHEITAKVLEKTEDTLIVVPEIPNVIVTADELFFAGVNIFLKKSIAVTPEFTK